MADQGFGQGATAGGGTSALTGAIVARHISRISSVFDAAPIGVGVWSVDGQLLHANPVLCDLLQSEIVNLLGQPIEMVLLPGDRGPVKQYFDDICHGDRNAFSCNFACGLTMARPLLVRAEMTVVYGPAGQPEYLLSQIFDFSPVAPGPLVPTAVAEAGELEALRRELSDIRRDHAEVKRLFDTVTDVGPVAVVRLDTRGRITYANGHWADIIDDHQDRLRGFKWHRLLDPSHLDDIVVRGLASLETGAPFTVRVASTRAALALDPESVDGGIQHWAVLRVAPVFLDSGEHDGWVAALTDVSAEVAADSRAAQLAQALDAGSDFLMIAERTGAISHANNAARESLGVHAVEDGKAPSFIMDVLEADSLEAWHEHVQPTLLQGGVWRGELNFSLVSGEHLPVSALFNAHYDASGRLDTIFAVARDISDIKVAERKLHQMATHDYLTGMPNRVLLYDRIEQALARYDRYHQPVALLYVDLDRFKQVNDEHGHHVGDSVLRCVADRVHELVRDTDTAARVGGDEFCLLIEGIADRATLEVVAERLIAAISAPIVLGDVQAEIGASIGLVQVDDSSADVDVLMALADTAMYRAKASGRGQAFVHDPTQPAGSPVRDGSKRPDVDTP